MIKCIAISDLHGDLPVINEEFDVLLIGGDICPAYKHTYDFQHYWMQQYFVPWVMELPFKDEASKVVFIGGNHDVYLYQEPKPTDEGYSSIYTDLIRPCGGRLVYLEDDEYIYESLEGETIKIYGTPWCKIFGNWWFMRNDEFLKLAFDAIPDDTDVLLTHDAPAIPPYGIIQMGWYKGTDAGNIPLAEAIKEKSPKWAIHGHIHSSPHEVSVCYFKEDKPTNICCVSIKNENYDVVYEPLVFSIKGKKSAKDGEE